jgi:cytochrome c553
VRQTVDGFTWWRQLALGVAMVLPAHAQNPAVNPDAAKELAYGQHLGRECTACHRLDGVDNGIPGIIGWPAETLIATMGFYRDGSRPNPAMASVAQSLDEPQIQALAIYFASLPQPPKQVAPAKKK